MTEHKRATDRRAQHVALSGFALQSAAFALVVGLSLWRDSHALAALARFLLAGMPIWFVLYLILNQVRRAGLETMETEEFRRAQEAGTSQTIFELDEEALLLEQNRLQWMVRWLLPACTIAVACLLLFGHFILWGWSLNEAFDETVLQRTQQPTMMMWFAVGVGFGCFLFARYALALARLPGWSLLRAGAVCTAGNAMACLAVALALMASGTIEWAEPAVTYLIRVTLLVLGAEFAGNFILDLYRPRAPGEVPRPSFDSRLLGMIGEPGGFTKSVTDAVNYQFGFQVSSTWFYQLLQRWLFPIVALAFGTVILLTSVVVVDADEQVTLQRFGRLVTGSDGALTPGIHLKWPYPITIAQRVPVKRIGELVIGEAAEEDDEHAHEAILWTQAHDFIPELMLLVAAPKLEEVSDGPESAADTPTDAGATESVAVSLLMVSVPIEYRIKDINKYLYRYADPEKLMEAVAYQYLSDFAASVDIDELMGPGRDRFNKELKHLIQARLDELDVGIEVVFAGLRGAHPPAKDKVAAAFQGVISAETSMSATIHGAEGFAQRILTSVAGTVSRARALDEAIRARNALPPGATQLRAANRHVQDLLMGRPERGMAPISGEAAALIAGARAEASKMISQAAAKARVFSTQIAAYEASPELYRQRRTLEVYEEEGLRNIRKYLIVGDPSDVIVEYEATREAGLDQVLSEGVEEERRKAANRP